MRAHGNLTRCETESERAARLAATAQVRRVLEHGCTECEQRRAQAVLAALNAPKPQRQGILPLVAP